MTSTDGFVWVGRNVPGPGQFWPEWFSVTYGAGTFVAVGQDAILNSVMSSSDNGATWTRRNSAAALQWQSVTFGNGLFVAVAIDGAGNRVQTSPDGITWTSRASAANNAWRSVTFGGCVFVAVSSTGVNNRVMVSTDGTTWQSKTNSNNQDRFWLGVGYGNNLFVAVANGDGGDNQLVMTSPL